MPSTAKGLNIFRVGQPTPAEDLSQHDAVSEPGSPTPWAIEDPEADLPSGSLSGGEDESDNEVSVLLSLFLFCSAA